MDPGGVEAAEADVEVVLVEAEAAVGAQVDGVAVHVPDVASVVRERRWRLIRPDCRGGIGHGVPLQRESLLPASQLVTRGIGCEERLGFRPGMRKARCGMAADSGW